MYVWLYATIMIVQPCPAASSPSRIMATGYHNCPDAATKLPWFLSCSGKQPSNTTADWREAQRHTSLPSLIHSVDVDFALVMRTFSIRKLHPGCHTCLWLAAFTALLPYIAMMFAPCCFLYQLAWRSIGVHTETELWPLVHLKHLPLVQRSPVFHRFSSVALAS